MPYEEIEEQEYLAESARIERKISWRGGEEEAEGDDYCDVCEQKWGVLIIIKKKWPWRRKR